MKSRVKLKHKPFCYAGQPAPCKGYFPNDVLPCICGVEGSVTVALAQLCPLPPILFKPLGSSGNRPKVRRAAASHR